MCAQCARLHANSCKSVDLRRCFAFVRSCKVIAKQCDDDCQISTTFMKGGQSCRDPICDLSERVEIELLIQDRIAWSLFPQATQQFPFASLAWRSVSVLWTKRVEGYLRHVPSGTDSNVGMATIASLMRRMIAEMSGANDLERYEVRAWRFLIELRQPASSSTSQHFMRKRRKERKTMRRIRTHRVRSCSRQREVFNFQTSLTFRHGFPNRARRLHFWCWCPRSHTKVGWALKRFIHRKQHARAKGRSGASRTGGGAGGGLDFAEGNLQNFANSYTYCSSIMTISSKNTFQRRRRTTKILESITWGFWPCLLLPSTELILLMEYIYPFLSNQIISLRRRDLHSPTIHNAPHLHGFHQSLCLLLRSFWRHGRQPRPERVRYSKRLKKFGFYAMNPSACFVARKPKKRKAGEGRGDRRRMEKGKPRRAILWRCHWFSNFAFGRYFDGLSSQLTRKILLSCVYVYPLYPPDLILAIL